MSINKITRADVERFRLHNLDMSLEAGNAVDLYQELAIKSAIYPGQGTPLGLIYVALKGAGEAGEFAEHVGKAMRDDGLIPLRDGIGPVAEYMDANEGERYTYAGLDAKLTDSRRELLIKEIGDQLWYLAAKCNELGISLSYAALMNLEKLCDRTERDALRGSGDSR